MIVSEIRDSNGRIHRYSGSLWQKLEAELPENESRLVVRCRDGIFVRFVEVVSWRELED